MATTLQLLRQGRFRAKGIGSLALMWAKDGVVRVGFPESPETGWQGIPRDKVPEWIHEPLAKYFRGHQADPRSVPVVLEGTEFQKKVWCELRKIPRGEVRTYGAVAADVGSPRGMRAVGMANRSNPLPILVPCHRVVQAGLRLGGYAGGLDRKRYLLALEGVEFAGDRVHPGQLVLPRAVRSGSPRRASRR